MMEIKKISKSKVSKLWKTHTFIGGACIDGIRVGVEHPNIEPESALYILNKKFGCPNGEVDQYKTTFEYVFEIKGIKNVYFTIYDYKGYMSCGFGVPKGLVNNKITKEKAEFLNNALKDLLIEVYRETQIYDYIYDPQEGWK